MTSTPRPRRTAAFLLRVLAAALAVCCTALGIAAAPAVAAPHARSGSAPALDKLTFTSLSNGRNLDVQNGNTGDGAYIVTNSTPGYHQTWHLNVDKSDSSFTIVNNDTGKCVDLAWLTPALRQQTCRGAASQKWYLQPVGAAKDTFMIRHQGDNTCLDLLMGANYDDAWTDQYTCNNTRPQQWTTGPATALDAWNLAVDHAAKQCQKDTATCSWATRAESPAAPLPKVCASSVWFNNTGDTVQQGFAVTDTSGWQNSIGVDMGTQIAASAGTPGGGTELQTTVSSTLHATHVWEGSRAVNNQVTVNVPTKQYGWVTLSELAKKVTGTWTFDTTGFPWTADDTITVPLKDDPSGGATLYIANTSPNFTSCT
ncbi:RICIN domain-containing protein [Streptomyces lydicus]|uniref:RICIN domain-containing protein n=1 Tax=Streptomyces lydicus TaxID=47763 RepID=UPI0036FE8595